MKVVIGAATMNAAIARPSTFFSLPVVDRKISSISPVVRLESRKFTPDDVDECSFSRKSKKCWDKFYKRHQSKFFKDRHYLEKDWGKYFTAGDNASLNANTRVLLEIGCGAGNTVFPLVAAYPELFVHACDFSAEALSLVKSNSQFDMSRINLFICDVANEELCDKISPASVDVVTLIFMLSAVSPSKMASVLQNLKKVLKPNGHVLVRDYALGDYAQVKLEGRNRMVDENFYYRGDGTYSFYFSEDFLSTLFAKMGFIAVDINIYCRQVENRFRNMTFQRYAKTFSLFLLSINIIKLGYIDRIALRVFTSGVGFVPFSKRQAYSFPVKLRHMVMGSLGIENRSMVVC